MKTPFSTRFLISSLVVSATVLQAQSKFVYTNNDLFASNSVSGFSVGANGALTEISGSPFSTGGGGTGGGGYAVNRIVVAGAGKYLYASNGGDHNIAAFSVDANTGFLAAVPGSPFAAGGAWGDITLAGSPDGQFLFVGTASNKALVTFMIGAGGALTQASGIVLPAVPTGMKVTPDGKFLAAGMPGYIAGAVAMFSIAANGALTLVNGMPFLDSGSGNLSSVDINCAGTNVFGSEMTQASTIVDVFSINSSGVLARIQGSPFAPGVGTNSNVAALSANDHFLFVTNQVSATVTAFAVDSAGALTLVAGSPFAIGAGGSSPAGVATDGSFLYVASSSNSVNGPGLVHVFTIAADGSVAAAPGSPFSTGQSGSNLLSLTAFPAKACAAPGGGTPPPPDPDPVPPPPTEPPPTVPPPPSNGPMAVKIDIKPEGDGHDDHDDKNKINPKSHGKVKVAILSGVGFDAPRQVDMNSLTFGHNGSEHSLAFCDAHREDANADRRPDLTCHFYVDKANFQKNDTIGILKGKMLDGTSIEGSDSIR